MKIVREQAEHNIKNVKHTQLLEKFQEAFFFYPTPLLAIVFVESRTKLAMAP